MPEINLKKAKILDTGKYFRRIAVENRYVQLDPDVAPHFQNERALNELLRAVIRNTAGQRVKRRTA